MAASLRRGRAASIARQNGGSVRAAPTRSPPATPRPAVAWAGVGLGLAEHFHAVHLRHADVEPQQLRRVRRAVRAGAGPEEEVEGFLTVGEALDGVVQAHPGEVARDEHGVGRRHLRR